MTAVSTQWITKAGVSERSVSTECGAKFTVVHDVFVRIIETNIAPIQSLTDIWNAYLSVLIPPSIYSLPSTETVQTPALTTAYSLSQHTHTTLPTLLMRFQFSNVLRTLFTISNLARTRASQQNPLLRSLPQRATHIRSMPSIPILGSLFGTKAAADSSMTSYPDKRDENEWRAVLNKGKNSLLTTHNTLDTHQTPLNITSHIANSFA